MKYNGNDNDFQAIKKHARKLKQELSGSTFVFGDAKRELTTDYREGFQYSPENAKGAKESLDPELLKNLRATHFSFAPDGGEWAGDTATRFVSDSEMNNRKLMEDMKTEKRDPRKEAERNLRMKLKLTRNTFKIGNDPEYMY